MSYLPTVIAVEGSDTALASTLSTLSTTLLYSLLSLLYSTPALQGRSTCVWLAGASLLSTRYSLRGSGQRAVRSGAVGPFFAQLAGFCPESWCRGRCRAAVVRVESGLEMSFSGKLQTETKPIPMKWQTQKPHTKPILFCPKIPIFNQILTRTFTKFR